MTTCYNNEKTNWVAQKILYLQSLQFLTDARFLQFQAEFSVQKTPQTDPQKKPQATYLLAEVYGKPLVVHHELL